MGVWRRQDCSPASARRPRRMRRWMEHRRLWSDFSWSRKGSRWPYLFCGSSRGWHYRGSEGNLLVIHSQSLLVICRGKHLRKSRRHLVAALQETTGENCVPLTAGSRVPVPWISVTVAEGNETCRDGSGSSIGLVECLMVGTSRYQCKLVPR